MPISTLIDNAGTTLASAYTAGSGSVVLFSGYGDSVRAKLTAVGATISPTRPLRFTLIERSANGVISPATKTADYSATGLTGDTLTGVTVAEGTTDQNFAAGDVFAVFQTAGVHEELVSAIAAAGTNNISAVSVATANGFAGTATATTTPVVTLTTSVTGLVKGNGTALSAATAGVDYVTPSGSITGSAGTITGSITESQVANLVTDLGTHTSAIATNTANIAANTTAIALKADDSAVVHRTGTETVTGVKAFSSQILGSCSGNAALSHTHAATDVTSGVLAPARLASGTPAAGKYPDGAGAWTALPSASPGGSSGQLQYNNAGAFGGTSQVVYAGSGTILAANPSANTDRLLSLTQLSRTANISTVATDAFVNVTAVTTAAHGLVPGQTIKVTGSAVANLNGSWIVSSVPNSTTVVFGTPYVTPNLAATSDTGVITSTDSTTAPVRISSGVTGGYVQIWGDGTSGMVGSAGTWYWTSPLPAPSGGRYPIEVYGAAVLSYPNRPVTQPWMSFNGSSTANSDSPARIAYRRNGVDTCAIDMGYVYGDLTCFNLWAGNGNAGSNLNRAISVSTTGSVTLANATTFGSTAPYIAIGNTNAPISTAQVRITAAGNKALVLQGDFYSGSNIFELQTINSSTALSYINSTNQWVIGSGGGGADGALTVTAFSSSARACSVRGIASQTGVLLPLLGQSSTTAGRDMAFIDAAWADSTDATRKGRVIISACDNATTTTAGREGIRVESNGSAALLGFYGATAVAKAASPGTASGTDAAVINAIKTIISNVGLCS